MPKKTSNKDYFTLDVGSAIIKYNISESIKEKHLNLYSGIGVFVFVDIYLIV